MKYVVCPAECVDFAPTDTVIFMAGGITGCPDWQSEMVARLQDVGDNVILLNPRRHDFDCSDASDAAQIKWEFEHLQISDWIYFWFPKEGRCMITLFELGCALGEGRNIRVGVEPGYVREQDIFEQLKHRAPGVTIHKTLDELYAPLLTSTN